MGESRERLAIAFVKPVLSAIPAALVAHMLTFMGAETLEVRNGIQIRQPDGFSD